MSRRIAMLLLAGTLAFTAACTNKKVHNPLANVDSKQPDKVLFDRAMDAMKHNRFDVARMTLQTMINAYPDSEYIARAKLAVADSWYAEGGTTALAQAEVEYNDFKTFFPNMPEAAEAQLKIANIHYQQMDKPDRDFTHAMRAEEEYRNLILQFPDSKLVPEAKKKLLEVQEILAQREFAIGRFYYLREIYPASIARLRSVVDRYPLYSKADEALYLLGQSYEREIALVESRGMPTNPAGIAARKRLLDDFSDKAAEAYSRIITRYPMMERTDDAKARLAALHKPIPRPTHEAIVQNKAEEASRHESGTLAKVMSTIRRHPDTSMATTVGEPTLVNPPSLSATEVVRQATSAMAGTSEPGSVSVETVKTGAPPPNQAAPRSDNPAVPENPNNPLVYPDTGTTPGAAPADANELKPNTAGVAADPNELKPNVESNPDQPLPAPVQTNEINSGTTPAANGQKPATAATSQQEKEDEAAMSSSKHKKKKGIRKIVPL